MDGAGMDTLLQLAAAPGITGSAGEAAMGRAICDPLMKMDYFRDRPGQVSLLPVAGDPCGRSVVCALLEGSRAGRGPGAARAQSSRKYFMPSFLSSTWLKISR